MSFTTDIAATYKGPRRVFRRLLDRGAREDRALAILMAGCVVTFVAQWPGLSRQAHLTGEDLNPLLGASLVAWVFFAPLILYTLSLLAYWVGKVLRSKGTPFGARLALFWSFLAASPLILLHGLVKGFIGDGAQLQLVGFVWFLFFLWFWISGMIEAGRGDAS